MPTIGAAVDELIAKARRTTASRLAASLIIDFLSREDANAGTLPQAGLPSMGRPEARGGTKSETVYVRLEPYYFAELGRLAQERNWYRATYLANLFYAHADRRPVLCDAEIDAVRQVARQLAHLGRNINQIAKAVNAAPDMAELTPPADFDVVRMLIDLETAVVKDLLTANLRGWGVSDGNA
jgi:hypothetical protein